jgi:hypothetical protein
MSSLEVKDIGTEMFELQQMLSEYRIGVRRITSPAGVSGLARMEAFYRWELREPTIACPRGHGEQEIVYYSLTWSANGSPCTCIRIACRCWWIEKEK